MKTIRNISCRDIHREIEEADQGEPLSATVSDHLKSCAGCDTFYDEQSSLRLMVASLGTVAAPNDFHFRLRARLAGEKRSQATSLASSRWSFGFRSAAFATMVLALGAAILFAGFRPGETPTPVADGAVGQPGSIVAVAPPPAETIVPSANGSSDSQGARTDINLASKGRRKSPAVRRGPGAAQLASAHMPRVKSQDLSSTQARILRPDAPDAVAEMFPLQTPTQQVKVSLDDGRGSSKTISLPGVSFGSQRVLAQSSTPVLASARGAW